MKKNQVRGTKRAQDVFAFLHAVDANKVTWGMKYTCNNKFQTANVTLAIDAFGMVRAEFWVDRMEVWYNAGNKGTLDYPKFTRCKKFASVKEAQEFIMTLV